MQIEKVDISNLKLLENNPRKITKDQMQKLCKSLQDDPNFLNNRPILVHENNGILQVYAGNQRIQAAKKLGWKQIPCIIEKDLSDDLIKSRIVKDNKTYGEFDFDILANEWNMETLFDAGFSPLELGIEDIEKIESLDEQENETLETNKDEDAITKPGDIYELNNHRIVCGDSTLTEFVSKCLNDLSPILMVTDPPYGVNYDANWRNEADRANGRPIGARATMKVNNDDRCDWTATWALSPSKVEYIWHGGRHAAEA